MPSYLAGRTSRISKPTPLRRQSSSPFAAAPRTKTFQRTRSLADVYEDNLDDGVERLDDTGKFIPTVEVEAAKDVIGAIEHAKATMFCVLPSRAGMNSTRISEVLNFQKNMPSTVSLAHVHALVSASSKTERQISELLASGQLRKLRLIGRGNDVSGLGEVLILTRDLKAMLESVGVPQEVTSSFLGVLREQPRVTTISSSLLPDSHITTLMRAGFLVGSSLAKQRNTSLGGSSLVSIPTISRAHSGSSGAVGGDSAFENLGGVGAAKRHGYQDKRQCTELALSVPNIGIYARLLNAGRSHFVDLLGKSKYKESPQYLLRERWDGAVDNEGSVSTAKRIRGEFSEVIPAKTKKWAKLSGLNFDWVLEECLGAGMIEMFETRSVGLGVRTTI